MILFRGNEGVNIFVGMDGSDTIYGIGGNNLIYGGTQRAKFYFKFVCTYLWVVQAMILYMGVAGADDLRGGLGDYTYFMVELEMTL